MVLSKCNAVLTTLMGVTLMFAVTPRPTELVSESGLVREDAILEALPRIEVVQGNFKPNSTLVATLVDFDVPSELAQTVAKLIQPVFDVRAFRSGRGFKLEKDANGTLRNFQYRINEDKVLEVQKGSDADTYEARVSTIELEGLDTVVTGEITSESNNLYAALSEQSQAAVALADKVA